MNILQRFTIPEALAVVGHRHMSGDHGSVRSIIEIATGQTVAALDSAQARTFVVEKLKGKVVAFLLSDKEYPHRPARDDQDQIDLALGALKDRSYYPAAVMDDASADDAWVKCERIYHTMQNGVVTPSWTLDPPAGFRPLVGGTMHKGRTYGHRSMCVGDLILIDGTHGFVVARFGCVALPAEAPVEA